MCSIFCSKFRAKLPCTIVFTKKNSFIQKKNLITTLSECLFSTKTWFEKQFLLLVPVTFLFSSRLSPFDVSQNETWQVLLTGERPF